MTQAITTTMSYTADFNSLEINNPNNWSGQAGGIGTKRQDEVEAETIEKDDTYPLSGTSSEFSRAVSAGDFSNSYGNSILTNIARGTADTSSGMNPNNPSRNMSPSQEAIHISMNSNGSVATTPALLPSDLTTADRINGGSKAFDVGSLSNPNTLGDTMTGLIEKVHANAVSYENQSDMMINKNKGTAYDQAKDALISDYDSLAGGIEKKENKQSAIERQIEDYIQVMNSSYEYYIYSSLFVDTGKSISQTAQSLTKG